jgi:hypothetical protein
MSYEDAIYALAHQNGVDITRELDAETVARVAGYLSQLSSSPASGGRPSAPARRTNARPVLIEIAGVDVGKIPGMTQVHAREAKLMSTRVYPLLYVFENSARDVISRVLTAGVGPDWWQIIVPERPIRLEVAKRMRKEGLEAWHSKRSGNPLQYVDLPWLADIVRLPEAWPHFTPIFPRETWFDSVVDDLNISRRVLAHMNPLSSDDIKAVENGFRKWVKQLQARDSYLP